MGLAASVAIGAMDALGSEPTGESELAGRSALISGIGDVELCGVMESFCTCHYDCFPVAFFP